MKITSWVPRLTVLLGALVFLAAQHTPATAQTTKIRVSVVPIIDLAPLYAAVRQGYFAAEKLEVDTSPVVGGAAGLPALAAGQVQIAFSNVVSTALGTSQGLGFKMIAPAADAPQSPPDASGIMMAKGKGFRTGKDLEGKRLGVNVRNNVTWLYSRAWVEKTGGDPNKVTYLEVPFPQMADALKSGQIDAAFIVDPFLSAGVESGALELLGWPYNQVQPGMSVSQYVTTERFLKSNPQQVEAFVRALKKGIVWMNENAGKPEWVKLISGYTRMTEDRVRTLHVAPYKLSIDPVSIDASLELMRKHGMLTTPLTSQQLIYSPNLAAKN